ncbi:MAG TPA: single-stranded-DNA-specific exonuclease RecJ, partial [Planctomycetia bacterium]|nr:single-stranded-DNA-specific exonuclease RecJ [Planctomycetia bacterium]
DYDVDGMCATAILLECLKIGGVAATFYIPDRLEEGYGVNAAALRHLRETEKVDLLVTVDCGIGSAAEAQLAREIGLELIVTDHHELPPELPGAAAIVHPRLPGAEFPCPHLCGAGVAYKLAWELARRFSGGKRVGDEFRRFLLDATTLAAVGTICDVVPLQDENRIIVHHGLISLQEAPPLGLKSLARQAGLGEKAKIGAGDVGFTLGPRLNAAGRLGAARLGVELLVTRDERRAAQLAEYLEVQNRQRQTLERRMFTRAKELATEQYGDDPSKAAVIILVDNFSLEHWHPGVLGIVASRVAERFHRPSILLAATDGAAAGSGRSVPGFHLQSALLECSGLLRAAGGHAMAVGVRLDLEQVDSLRAALDGVAASVWSVEERAATLRLDAELPLHSLNLNLMRALESLEPFGFGNAGPLLLATDLELAGEPKALGGGERHLSFQVKQRSGGTALRAIAFDMADRKDELLSESGRCCLAFTPQINLFRGYASVELRVRDLRAGSAPA